MAADDTIHVFNHYQHRWQKQTFTEDLLVIVFVMKANRDLLGPPIDVSMLHGKLRQALNKLAS